MRNLLVKRYDKYANCSGGDGSMRIRDVLECKDTIFTTPIFMSEL